MVHTEGHKTKVLKINGVNLIVDVSRIKLVFSLPASIEIRQIKNIYYKALIVKYETIPKDSSRIPFDSQS